MKPKRTDTRLTGSPTGIWNGWQIVVVAPTVASEVSPQACQPRTFWSMDVYSDTPDPFVSSGSTVNQKKSPPGLKKYTPGAVATLVTANLSKTQRVPGRSAPGGGQSSLAVMGSITAVSRKRSVAA